jgi:hypothetical protein
LKSVDLVKRKLRFTHRVIRTQKASETFRVCLSRSS